MSPEAQELQSSSDPVLRAVGVVLEKVESLEAKHTHLSRQFEAMKISLDEANRLRKEGDDRLDRSLSRLHTEMSAVERAQGVQATMVSALCSHLGIREQTIHETSAASIAGRIPRGGE